jgi:hypothetical protein
MISVSDRQFRIVATAADLLPVEARGTFLQRVTAELRARRDFSDCDVEHAVRAALLDQSAARSLLRTRLRAARVLDEDQVSRMNVAGHP